MIILIVIKQINKRENAKPIKVVSNLGKHKSFKRKRRKKNFRKLKKSIKTL